MQADPNSTNQGHYLLAAGRLKPGVTLESARANMIVAGERSARANPKWMDKSEGVAVIPLRDALVGDVRLALLILVGAVGFVLLIACANVANLLLARAAGRQREIAIRTAIGASRGHLIRQLLTESVLLSVIGGVLGLLIGAWSVPLLLAVSPGNLPRINDQDHVASAISALDWHVLVVHLRDRASHWRAFRTAAGAANFQAGRELGPEGSERTLWHRACGITACAACWWRPRWLWPLF